METVTISPKFQIVIPRKVRDFLKLKPGLKVQVMVYGNRIELIPLKKISKMRGFLEGISINLNDDLALQAAKISLDHKISMVDSIILATARAHEAVLWTQDQDFKDMENVNYFPK